MGLSHTTPTPSHGPCSFLLARWALGLNPSTWEMGSSTAPCSGAFVMGPEQGNPRPCASGP